MVSGCGVNGRECPTEGLRGQCKDEDLLGLTQEGEGGACLRMVRSDVSASKQGSLEAEQDEKEEEKEGVSIKTLPVSAAFREGHAPLPLHFKTLL